MSDFRKNPKRPFEVQVPNKIRKRIAMHEKKDSKLWKFIRAQTHPALRTPAPKVRGSLWSRFTNGVAKMLQIKPTGVRK